jgi:hypothetical protein
MRTVTRTLPRAALALAFCLGTVAPPAQAEAWEWTLAPYLWGSSISADVFVNDEPVIGGDLSFSDILDKLDMAFQIHFEGRREKLGFFLDYTYLAVGDSQTTEGPPPPPVGTLVGVDVDTQLVEVGGFFRPSGAPYGLDVYAGARIMDMGIDLSINRPAPLPPTSADASDTFTDGFAGLRYSAPLGEKWAFSLKGDLGAGDSEQAWNVQAVLAWHFGQTGRYSMLLGYRHLEAEYKSNAGGGAEVRTEMTMSGPAAGLLIRF